jgi:hypothetical protein
MKLAALVREIEAASGPVTGVELAQRLDTNPAEIGAMLVALRASGWLVTDGAAEPPAGDCGSAGSCSMSCPGPDKCGLVIDLPVANLEIRRASPRPARS